MSSYQRACRNAIDVQDASNFSGVLRAFAEDMEAVREQLRAEGAYSSHAFAVHPVALMYMDKLADLQRRPDPDALYAAFKACRAAFTPAPQEAS